MEASRPPPLATPGWWLCQPPAFAPHARAGHLLPTVTPAARRTRTRLRARRLLGAQQLPPRTQGSGARWWTRLRPGTGHPLAVTLSGLSSKPARVTAHRARGSRWSLPRMLYRHPWGGSCPSLAGTDLGGEEPWKRGPSPGGTPTRLRRRAEPQRRQGTGEEPGEPLPLPVLQGSVRRCAAACTGMGTGMCSGSHSANPPRLGSPETEPGAAPRAPGTGAPEPSPGSAGPLLASWRRRNARRCCPRR